MIEDDDIIEMKQNKDGVFVEDKSASKPKVKKDKIIKIRSQKLERTHTIPAVNEFLEGFDIGTEIIEKMERMMRRF